MSQYTDELSKKFEGVPLDKLPRSEMRKTKLYKMSSAVQRFYESHLVSPWQKEKVNEIRGLYEYKQKNLDREYNIASTKLSAEFMEFELQYLETSDRLKQGNEGKEPYHKDGRRFLSRAYWSQIKDKLYGKKEAAS